MHWENVTDENCAVFECTSMITNALTINSGGRTAAARAAESRARSVQRRLNIEPVQMTFDETEENSNSSPVKDKLIQEEMSLYSGNSPQGSPRPCSISPCLEIGLLSPLRESEVIEERHDIDFNSVDSGYNSNSRKLFEFVEPSGLAPRASPPKTTSRTSPKSTSCFRPFNSLSSDSMESMDDECIDLYEMESFDETTQLPTSFNTIISGDSFNTIINGNAKPMSNENLCRPALQRCLSLTDSNVNRGKKAVCDPKTPDRFRAISESASPFNQKTFKRPEPPTLTSPVQSKRYKLNKIEDKENVNEPTIARPILRKSVSMNDDIMNALARSSSVPNLIGDCSKPFCLPLIDGKHRDLRSISAHTMAQLIRGEFKNTVASYRVIDCRYPYEFEGGHIHGAENLYTPEQIMKELVNSKTESPSVSSEETMRNIIIFHCEFSSERGPKLSRFLRSNDRTLNANAYPALHYPEVYLLHNGYKEFFESFPELCDPVDYRPMADPSFIEDCRQCRAKSRSWNGNGISRTTSKSFEKKKSRNLIY